MYALVRMARPEQNVNNEETTAIIDNEVVYVSEVHDIDEDWKELLLEWEFLKSSIIPSDMKPSVIYYLCTYVRICKPGMFCKKQELLFITSQNLVD